MELDTESYCRICGAPLAWRYLRNALVPLNVEPDPTGGVYVRDDNTAELVTPCSALAPQLYSVHEPGIGCPDLCVTAAVEG
ncbi:hypothetical protein IU431_06740 [Nocardia otitidiscaviarum]|uniref:hypothetical protein n=1 Tax=Nocardia otitidiscaviarum TaxID=1823 RepID=UPI0004A73BEC|nr:hypothetical protein [Nocardia otitidiscaviarum]MBF6483854.1 hypothetical protein [Nocardia otitidiscaviarum]